VTAEIFEAFRAELVALGATLDTCRFRTLRDEAHRDRFRTLYRVWISTVAPAIQPTLGSKAEFSKLAAEIEALAALTSKFRPISEYRKRLTRAVQLAAHLVLFLPPTHISRAPCLKPLGEEVFVRGVPDLPLRLVPNAILGWKRRVEAFVERYPFDKSVFLMIRYRARNRLLVRAIKNVLSLSNLTAIVASEHRVTDDLYNAIACLLCCSRGIAVFDEPEPEQVFNPNVAYELGMMHLLGRECLILKHTKLDVLPADILMKLYSEYRAVGQARALVQGWLGGAG
jgi:hypothetical protein